MSHKGLVDATNRIQNLSASKSLFCSSGRQPHFDQPQLIEYSFAFFWETNPYILFITGIWSMSSTCPTHQEGHQGRTQVVATSPLLTIFSNYEIIMLLDTLGIERRDFGLQNIFINETYFAPYWKRDLHRATPWDIILSNYQDFPNDERSKACWTDLHLPIALRPKSSKKNDQENINAENNCSWSASTNKEKLRMNESKNLRETKIWSHFLIEWSWKK